MSNHSHWSWYKRHRDAIFNAELNGASLHRDEPAIVGNPAILVGRAEGMKDVLAARQLYEEIAAQRDKFHDLDGHPVDLRYEAVHCLERVEYELKDISGLIGDRRAQLNHVMAGLADLEEMLSTHPTNKQLTQLGKQFNQLLYARQNSSE